MRGYSKKISRLIREFSMEAHERELHRELIKLDVSFTEWRRGEIGSGELSFRVHDWDTGPSRELFKQYNSGYPDMNVAYALVTGILEWEEVPEELVEAVSGSIAFYESQKAKDNLRMPGE